MVAKSYIKANTTTIITCNHVDGWSGRPHTFCGVTPSRLHAPLAAYRSKGSRKLMCYNKQLLAQPSDPPTKQSAIQQFNHPTPTPAIKNYLKPKLTSFWLNDTRNIIFASVYGVNLSEERLRSGGAECGAVEEHKRTPERIRNSTEHMESRKNVISIKRQRNHWKIKIYPTYIPLNIHTQKHWVKPYCTNLLSNKQLIKVMWVAFYIVLYCPVGKQEPTFFHAIT